MGGWRTEGGPSSVLARQSGKGERESGGEPPCVAPRPCAREEASAIASGRAPPTPTTHPVQATARVLMRGFAPVDGARRLRERRRAYCGVDGERKFGGRRRPPLSSNRPPPSTTDFSRLSFPSPSLSHHHRHRVHGLYVPTHQVKQSKSPRPLVLTHTHTPKHSPPHHPPYGPPSHPARGPYPAVRPYVIQGPRV